MSENRRRQVAVAIQRALNGIASADLVAYYLGYRPSRRGILAVTATLRSMERDKLVGRIPPEDQWSVAKWFLSSEGKAKYL